MKTLFKLLPAGCLALAAPALMLGAVYTYQTPANSKDASNDTVSAQATFTTGADSVTIDLSSLLSASAMLNAGQVLSDLSFSMNNSLTSASINSSTANFINIAANGSSAADHTGAVGWALTNTGSGTFHLDGLNGDSNPQSSGTIVGGSAGDTYSNANSSIAGNGPHNPFIATTAHWVLTITGVTANTTITSAIFSFGTASGDNVTGTCTSGCAPVPEPRTTSAFLVLGAMLGFLAYRKKFGTA